jgi:hypothetical protein
MRLLGLYGWHVCHVPTRAVVRNGRVWHETSYEGFSGLPDLICARDGRVILIELKTDAGKLSEGQTDWLAASGGLLWRPSDWPMIERFAKEGIRDDVR